MSAHPSTRVLALLARGLLAPPERAEIESHVDGCARCVGSLAAEARLELSLRALFRERRCGTAAVAVPRFERIEAEQPAPRSWGLFAAMAVIAVVLAAGAPASKPSLAIAAEAPCGGTLADAGNAPLEKPPALSWTEPGGDLSHGTP